MSTNNHFSFFPVYFFDQPEAQWEVFLQLSNKEGVRIKRGGLPSKLQLVQRESPPGILALEGL